MKNEPEVKVCLLVWRCFNFLIAPLGYYVPLANGWMLINSKYMQWHLKRAIRMLKLAQEKRQTDRHNAVCASDTIQSDFTFLVLMQWLHLSRQKVATTDRGGCGSGVEPASCYHKVAGLIPLVCNVRVSLCKIPNPKLLLMSATTINVWMYELLYVALRAVKIAPKWRLNIQSKKTYRFKTFKCIYICATRHSYLYRYIRDTSPRFWFFAKLSEARAINDTDQPRVLVYERSKFLRARLLSCCRQGACGGGEKYESRRGCSVGVPERSWHARLGAHFRGAPSCF